MALTTVLLLKLLGVVVGSPPGGELGDLGGALAFTVHDHGPMALLGLMVAVVALQSTAGSLPGKTMAVAQRLTRQLTGVLAILLATLFLSSAILVEMELRREFAQQQVDLEQEAGQLRDELERIQSPAFLHDLAEPGRLEALRAGFPSLSPDAAPEEAVAALEKVVLQDLNQLQQVQESQSAAGAREGWGTRFFSQLPDVVLAAVAAVVAAVALTGAESKTSPAEDQRPTD